MCAKRQDNKEIARNAQSQGARNAMTLTAKSDVVHGSRVHASSRQNRLSRTVRNRGTATKSSPCNHRPVNDTNVSVGMSSA